MTRPPPPRQGHSTHQRQPLHEGSTGAHHSHHGSPPHAPPRGRGPGQTPTLPDWLPGSQGSQVPRDTLNSTGTSQSRRTATVSAEGTVLPLTYGQDILGPIVTMAMVLGNQLVLRCCWCLGEIEAIVQVKTDDGSDIPGVVMTHYTGRSDQQPDPYLVANIAGYNDSCVVPIGGEYFGIAYSVIRIPFNANIGFPRFVATVKGLKVRDPRGINFYSSTIDGSFSAASGNGRAKISFDGTYHQYKSSPNTQAKAASALWTDSSVGLFECAIKPTVAGNNSVIFDAGNGKLQVLWATGNFIRVIGKNAASTTVLDCTSTVALTTNVDHSVAISWDLNQNKCIIVTDGDNTSGGVTATSGQTVNLSVVGVSVGGAYAGTALLDAYLSGVAFHTTFVDLADGIQLATVVDSQDCVKIPPFFPSGVFSATGYMQGFTYTNVPPTVSDPGTVWSTVGTVDKDRFVYPGLGGGLYYQNSVGDTGFYLKANASAVQATGGVRHGLYLRGIQYFGGVDVVASASGHILSLTGTGDVDQVVATTPQGSGENYTVQLTSGVSTAIRLISYNLFPEPQSYETRWLGEIGSTWTISVGSVTLADAVIGGIQSTGTATINKVTPLFVAGEEVFYTFEVSGTFTGSVALNLGGNALAQTAPGLYTGSVIASSTAINFAFAVSSGAAIVKRVAIVTKTAAKKWTKTPALVLADLIESDAYGLGGVVDDTSLLTACKFNEHLIYDNGSARHEIGLSLVERDSITAWLETLRAYARVFITPRGSTYYLVPDTTGTVVGSIDASDMLPQTFKPQKKSLRNLPNVVKVYYTNTAVNPWTEDFVEAVAPAVTRGEDFRRESSVRMPGIQTKSMAYRFAIERLNDSTLIDLVGSFVAKDVAFPFEVGDLVQISHPIGLTNKIVRFLSCDPGARGEIQISFSEYDANVYSDAIVDDPPPPDYGGGTPFQVPPVTGLRLEETFFIQGGAIGSQLEISWNSVNYAFLQTYIVEIYELPPPSTSGDTTLGGSMILPNALRNIAGTDTVAAGGVISAGASGTNPGANVYSIPPGGRLLATIRTPDTYYNYRPLSAGAYYYVRVYAQSTAYVIGDADDAAITALGYRLPPDFSQGAIVAYEAGDGLESYVSVGAIDIDLWGYEFRYRELSDQNWANKCGPQFNSADWSGATTSFVWGSHSMACIPITTSAVSVTVADTGIVVGKSYDVYVKIKSISYPTSSPSVGFGFGGNNRPYAGALTGIMWFGSDTTTPGVYKTRHPWTPLANGVLTFGSVGHAHGGTAFEVEYFAFRESEGGSDLDGSAITDQVSTDWDTAALIQRAASTACRVPNLPSGAYMVYCRALDSQRTASNPYGQYSADIQQAWSRVQRDDSSMYRIIHVLGAGSSQNYALYPKGDLQGFTYNDDTGTVQVKGLNAASDGGTWNSTFTGTLNSYVAPVWGAFEGVSPETWTSGTIDLGSTVSGSVKLNYKPVSLGDTITNNVSITIQSANNPSFIGAVSHAATGPELLTFTGRYLRVTLNTTGKKVGFINYAAMTLEVVATPRVESGSVLTLGPDGSGNPQPVTVTTSNAYSQCVSCRAWSPTGQPIDCYVDSITLGNPSTFTVIAVDHVNGIPVAATVNWEWRGV